MNRAGLQDLLWHLSQALAGRCTGDVKPKPMHGEDPIHREDRRMQAAEPFTHHLSAPMAVQHREREHQTKTQDLW